MRWLEDLSCSLEKQQFLTSAERIGPTLTLLQVSQQDDKALMRLAGAAALLDNHEFVDDDPARCGMLPEDENPSDEKLESLGTVSAYLRRGSEAHQALIGMLAFGFEDRWQRLSRASRLRVVSYALVETREMRRHVVPAAEDLAEEGPVFAPYSVPCSEPLAIRHICGCFWRELQPSHLVASDHLLQLMRREQAASEAQHVEFAMACLRHQEAGRELPQNDTLGRLQRTAQLRGGDARFSLCVFLRTVMELVCKGEGVCFACAQTFPVGQLKQCTRCKVELYCSASCQRMRWNERHKRLCPEYQLAKNYSLFDASFYPEDELLQSMESLLGSACGFNEEAQSEAYAAQLQAELQLYGTDLA